MEKNETKDLRPFSEKYPRLNLVFGILLIMALLGLCLILLYFAFKYIGIGIAWLKNITSKLDAVVIVALITGAVSITGVVIRQYVMTSAL